jgi:PAS domain S-box-containing protein
MDTLRTALRTFLISLSVLVLLVGVRWLLDPVLGNAVPFITVFAAVAFSAWIGGYPIAVVIAALGYAAASVLFLPDVAKFESMTLMSGVVLMFFIATCSVIIFLVERLRRARSLAQQQREILQITLASIGDAVITTDLQANVTYLNDVAQSLTGWRVEDAVGQPLEKVFEIVNETTRDVVESPVVRALKEGVIVGLANHTILIRRDGNEAAIDDSAAPIRDAQGNVTGCVLIFRDVSAHRRMEHERAEQLIAAKTLASIVETSDDAIISKTLDGVIRSWNAGAERVFGYRADEIVGRHVSMIIPPERLSEEDKIISELKEGRRVDHFETVRRRGDGKLIEVSITVSPIMDADGKVVGASKIARDITERKRMETELRQLAATLSEADRRKNEFLAMLAHELRNPLAPITNAAAMLKLAPQDVSLVQTATAMIERQVAQLARLVDDLLDMSRITSGKIELRRELVDLRSVVDQAVQANQVTYQSFNHQLTVAVPQAPVMVNADPIRTAQIVGNLLNNASKFTSPGGRIKLTLQSKDGVAELCVRDNGIGILPDKLAEVFGMFVQVDTSLHRSHDGLGIGLTLVKNLVEMHGGKISAHSDGLGKGSEFVIRLPLANEAESRAPVRNTTARLEPLRILIVDDNLDSAESLAMLLQLEGHSAALVHDGPQALVAVDRHRPNVVLLDIGLPSMDGFEVCRLIRERPDGDRILIFAVTGWGQDGDRQRSQAAGFDAHLTKPVDYELLKEKIGNGMSRKSGA